MDGGDAARSLGDAARTAQIPVVALTSLRLDDDGDLLAASGFAGYLEKPFRVRELADQVRRYCGES